MSGELAFLWLSCKSEIRIRLHAREWQRVRVLAKIMYPAVVRSALSSAGIFESWDTPHMSDTSSAAAWAAGLAGYESRIIGFVLVRITASPGLEQLLEPLQRDVRDFEVTTASEERLLAMKGRGGKAASEAAMESRPMVQLRAQSRQWSRRQQFSSEYNCRGLSSGWHCSSICRALRKDGRTRKGP